MLREHKQKHSRDFVRKNPTESSSSTAKAPPRSILTPEQSGQLVALAKDKKKRLVTPSMLAKALEASKDKRSRMPLRTKVLPNLLTPGGAELGDLARFVESWNLVDCPGNSSLSMDLLKGVEDSVHALQDQLEVNFFPFSCLSCISYLPVPEIRVELLILLGVRKQLGLNLQN